MGSKWRKVKGALGLSNMCVFSQRNHVADNGDDDFSLPSERPSDAVLLSPPGDWTSAPPTPPPNKLRLSKSFSRSSSKKTCSICLASMRQGDGYAIFTAECSHSFHFHRIASNVKHGNELCPVCRAKWKEIPLQGSNIDSPAVRTRINHVDWPENNAMMTVIRRLPPPRSNSTRYPNPLSHPPEPSIFNDDDPLNHERNALNIHPSDHDTSRKVTIDAYPEVSSAPKSSTLASFTILLHIKAPCSNSWHNLCKNHDELPIMSRTQRAPIDIVTVLDISGSMAGTKLALLKRAMGFVIQNLGPNDRLAVIAFSSSARRLFPLRTMSEMGRKQALQAVNSLVANGGTNIADGLKKGAKIMEDRREKNPVASIILLSDGQDTYTVNSSGGDDQAQPDYGLLLPSSIQPGESSGFKIPVHAFGFGADHDASSMHSISEISGGTFSFIETEGVIQDAFAQCIGGLLSVVVKSLQVEIECVHPKIHLGSLKTGSYPNHFSSNRRSGYIDVGDLYADEERDFLISINIPADHDQISSHETSMVKMTCVYNDPFTKETVAVHGEEVKIKRTDALVQEKNVSIKVERQQNRVQATEAMAKAQTAAENGDLAEAVLILEMCRKALSETESAKSQDKLCLCLDAELKEMQVRMTSRHVYEASGRAYILSGLSSHSWQRATARGDSAYGSSLFQVTYQTPLMVEMVTRSQASLLASPSTQRVLRR